MNTGYLSYYFAPLVSWWYLIIYGTMITASQYNDRPLFVLSKIIVSAVLVTTFMHQPMLLDFLFGLLKLLCNIQWSAQEWTFRVTLDLWIAYIGMIFALAYNRFNALRLSDDPRWPLVAKITISLSSVGFVWYFAFELIQTSKFTYNAWHPYISFIPVLAFIALRNATVVLRSAHSRAFAFIGKCSLETFIIQYHIWLAGDTKGILLVIPGTKWRPINFIVTTLIFIYLSDRLAHATTHITNQICGGSPKTLPTSVTNVSRNERPLTMEEHAGATEQSEPSKESTTSSDTVRSLDSVPARLQSLIGKYHSNVQVRLLLIVLVMWLVNLMWPSTN
jgi:hypothetical protein